MPTPPSAKPTAAPKAPTTAAAPSNKPNNGKATTPKPKAAGPAPVPKREAVYEKVGVKLYVGESAMTAEDMKLYLGWTEETAENKYEQDYLLKDENGHKVRCLNNTANRPFDEAQAYHVVSEILQGHWRLNGESMIIGKYGATLDIQHRGIGLILAVQLWHKNPGEYPAWPDKEPTIECLVVTGIDEGDLVVNTINTGKPRSFQDVLARSPLFRDMKSEPRNRAIKATDYALRLVWQRTGQGINALTTKRSHADSMEFLDNHAKLKECVIHVTQEDSEGKVSRYLTPGYMAGLMYLMACCKSDPVKYREAAVPGDSVLDMTLYQDAVGFITALAADDSSVKHVLKVIADTPGENGASRHERTGYLIKAWLLLVAGAKVVPSALKLEYEADANGVTRMINRPVLGGIDLGDKPDMDETAASTTDPTEDEIAQRSADIRAKREAKKKGGKVTLAEVGNDVWVEDDGGTFYGKVMEVYSAQTGMVARVRDHGGKHKIFEFPLADLLLSDPEQADSE